MKINIGIDLERLRNPNSGLGQFCKNLFENLLREEQNSELFSFYFPQGYSNFKQRTKNHTVNFLDKLIGVRNKNLQLFHCTHQDSHLFPKRIPTILTIHDLNFLEKYSSVKQQQKLKALQQKVSRAKGLTFISNFTKQLASRYLIFPDVPTKVIYNGNCLNTDLIPKRPEKLITGDYLFSIGIVNPKKNFHVLLPLIKSTNYNLVIAGNNSHEYVNQIKMLANEMEIDNRVVFLGPVTEEEKYWLYQNCKAFVFPSLSEGFGLPVIEAMSQGKPVFLSDKTSLSEVGGKHAYYWKNFDSTNMVEAFNDGIEDFESSKNKSQQLKEWALQFNWQKTARNYLDFYTEVYETLK
ncbi:glycosyltransferase family 4 protein [Aurantibacillus circumpalustris]|uniref:glycosyltransferase family 4 protein n=1 Tax=Aurantibacillus circumpalustris TaxID=3036359 RepID=UPI00295ABD97|nr:glycosyltransferase family 1 protein [Aurantibacillus circumpalustris]